MPLTAADIKFYYPEYISRLQYDKCGGEIGNTVVPADTEISNGDFQLFTFATYYGGTYTQYQKIFIKNTGSESALLSTLAGYNFNGNGIVTMALERTYTGAVVLNGDERIKNIWICPSRYVVYSFAEYPSISPVPIGTIAAGSSIGVWLKMEFSSIDAFAVNDKFVLEFNFNNGTPITKTFNLIHSRIDATADIIKVSRPKNNYRNLNIRYGLLDMSAYGLSNYDVTYGIFFDHMLKKENSGKDTALVQAYGSYVPFQIDVVMLPYSGFVPDLGSIAAGDKDRVKLVFSGKRYDIGDVDKYYVYWDNATGTYLAKPLTLIEAEDGYGGGLNVESVRIIP